ncbi:hypothetical protein GCM10028806_35020 [Spirosoma terrae]|uniref:Serine/threonine-protein phosphatase n=1 Tax=Spirosoma terrae TaxID=1968276 RepID=A0A6L9LD92_9BACT|nr:protein phosphatase 2C domain-containing protein [Spirosoma terrae]NDU97547.1 serine/threonine-protein phosphatase [Spirosoma terrae]
MIKIETYPPLALNEIGKRDNNEDSIFPSKGGAHEYDRLFLVCDGIGGNAKGEEASNIVCEAFDHVMESGRQPSNPMIIANALYYAEEQIDLFVQNNPEAKGMGTTMTLLHLHENGATIAHIGDSRVYHIRGRTIRFVTSDHKWVNKLVLSGDLSPEEALIHPRRNVIDRAILGRQERPSQADVIQVTDIRAGDYFFLCTDGILEGVDENQLVHILASDDSDTNKLGEIESRCNEKSMDNFSAYLVRIRSVNGIATPWTPSVIPLNNAEEVITAIKDHSEAINHHASEFVDLPIAQTPSQTPPSIVYPVDEQAFSQLQKNEKQKIFQGIIFPIVLTILCALTTVGGYYIYDHFIKDKLSLEQNPREARPTDKQPEKLKKENKKSESKQPAKKKEEKLLNPNSPNKDTVKPDTN